MEARPARHQCLLFKFWQPSNSCTPACLDLTVPLSRNPCNLDMWSLCQILVTNLSSARSAWRLSTVTQASLGIRGYILARYSSVNSMTTCSWPGLISNGMWEGCTTWALSTMLGVTKRSAGFEVCKVTSTAFSLSQCIEVSWRAWAGAEKSLERLMGREM